MSNKRKQAESGDKDDRVPVSLLSGFIGSGKTSLLKQILCNKENVKCAAIVSSCADLAECPEACKSSKNEEGDVTEVHFKNGCKAMIPEEGLTVAVETLAQSKKFSAIVVENVGTVDSSVIASEFVAVDDEEEEEEPEPKKQKSGTGKAASPGTPATMKDLARLDTVVTVVDASSFMSSLDSVKQMSDLEQDNQDGDEDYDDEEGGVTYVADLLVDQIEFTDVVVLNKADLVDAAKLEKITTLLKLLNPRAEVITSSSTHTGETPVPLKQLLDTGSFDVTLSQEPGWLVQVRHPETTKTPADATVIFRARKPFHPERLHKWITTHFALRQPDEDDTEIPQEILDGEEETEGSRLEAFLKSTMEKKKANKKKEVESAPGKKQEVLKEYGELMRSKGTIWLAGREDKAGDWDGRGPLLQIGVEGGWFCVTPEDEWPEDEETLKRIKADMSDDKEIGDRRQELVFMGANLKGGAIKAALEKCLLTDKEWKQEKQGKLDFDDPFCEWPDEEDDEEDDYDDDEDDDEDLEDDEEEEDLE